MWLFKNVFNPDSGERACVVFKHGAGDKIRVRVYNRRGAFIKDLIEETAGQAGLEQIYWDGTNDKGKKVVSGIYLILIQTSSYTATEKVAVIH